MVEGDNLVFHTKAIDGTAMKRLISRLIDHFGMAYTSHILDQVKTLGFQQATATSISLGIDDLLTIPSKGWLVQDAEQQSLILEKHHHYGNVHTVEKLRQSIEIWYATSEYLRQEMNLNFRMTDPFNPVHIMSFSGARGTPSQVHQLVGMRGLMSDPQGKMIELPIQSNLREGLSVTEYIISCYGARKGVVDTAVRTSDAGYLTRRLVEVVQHMVVRRKDCGTVRGIYVNPPNGSMPYSIWSQTLIGRVLADDIYMGSRCIATRNQDIGMGLIKRVITFRAQPISIRTPFSCKSTSWICQLCYGRSPAHGDLVELGEAVGIIAGQSIGEPGTQLTLRTFHTGGVFTGGTAEHVRAPSNGKIKFNENLVHPTRTRHGHPAFLCSIDFDVTIESEDIRHNVTIPSKSCLLVQNNQYVESEQVIAEIRSGTSTFHLKERVLKHIYSDSEGEMHWSTDVYHAPKFEYGNVHLLPKTSHLWILSGEPCSSSLDSLSLYKDQDQGSAHSLFVKRRSISNPSLTNDQARYKLFRSDFYGKKEDRLPDYSELNRIVCAAHSNLIYSAILHENSDLLAKRRRNRFLIPLQSIQERENELMTPSGISIEIPRNGLFHRKNILAYFDNPRYRRESSGITQYEYMVHSIVKKEDLIEDRGVTELSPKYEIEIGRVFFISEEVHLFPKSSSLMVRNNSLIGVDTQITLTTRSRIGGLVRLEIKKKVIALTILSGDIHFIGAIDKIFQPRDILIPPGIGKTNSKTSKKWKNGIYVQWITPTESFVLVRPIFTTKKSFKKSFVLVRPVVTYEKTDTNFPILFPPDRLQEGDNVQFQVVNCIRYRHNVPMRLISATSLQVVRDCLVLNWDQDKKSSSIEEARPSFVEIRTNGLVRDFLRIGVVKSSISYIGKRNDPSDSGLFSDNASARTNINPFSPTFFYFKEKIQQPLNQTIHTLLNRNNKCQSLIILPASNCSRMGPFNKVKLSTFELFFEEKMKKDPLMPIRTSLGPLGTSFKIPKVIILKIMRIRSLKMRERAVKIPNIHCLLSCDTSLLTNSLDTLDILECLGIFLVAPLYAMDENGKIYKPYPYRHVGLNPFYLNWNLVGEQSRSTEKPSTKMSLGQFLCENSWIDKNGPDLKWGQVIIVQVNSVVLRSAKPYLATREATVHGHYGEIFYAGDTLFTFLYEKSRSGDITQGLPKVEQVFEARSIDSNLEKRVEGWNECITRILGIPWGFLIGAELTIVQSRISLVNKIQKVYRSQGVQIHDRHIEIIVRQITSKVLVSEDAMSNLFLPGELIGLFQAERMGRALEETICYQAILLGITRASLNTKSFISEASFQETARVLAKAALRGRIDWLKGLKENVVLGGMIPVGTGFNKGLMPLQDNNILLETKKKNLFEGEMRDIFFHHRKLFDS